MLQLDMNGIEKNSVVPPDVYQTLTQRLRFQQKPFSNAGFYLPAAKPSLPGRGRA